MINDMVRIIDKHTLELTRDAKKGEIIDLNEITLVDTSMLVKRIEEAKELEYLKRLEEYKQSLNKIKEQEIQIALNDMKEQNTNLHNEIKTIQEQTKYQIDKIKDAHVNEIKQLNVAKDSKFEIEITKLENELKFIENKIVNEQKDKYTDKVHELQLKINTLEAANKELVLTKEKEIIDLKSEEKDKLIEIKDQYKSDLFEKEKEIEALRRERSSLNVKKIGENLEKWCDHEFQNQSLAIIEYITWQKDNEVIKGGKADFIYKVYADKNKNEDEILTSAVLEMKSEDPNSVNHQSNQKFFKKLNDDRNNKGLEYAILVSELEMDTVNDSPIQRISEYEKMYLVRPQYFTIFLNIITTFGIKYKEMFLDRKEEQEKFKDSKDILDEFEAMKNEILDNSMKHITTHVQTIIKQSETITQANKKLMDSAEMILNSHIKTIENKLNDFKIKKIISKIDKVEE